MAGLATLVIPKESVLVLNGQSSVEVTGLSMHDIVVLLQTDREELVKLLGGKNQSFGQILANAPKFAAKAIAAGAKEPELWEKAMDLPAGDQMRLLEKIWELSNFTAEELGNVVSLLSQFVARSASAIKTHLNSEALLQQAQEALKEKTSLDTSKTVPSFASEEATK